MSQDPNTRHEFDDDACCIHCGFDGAEWAHWKRNTYEGRASDMKQPLCERRLAPPIERPQSREPR